MYEVLKVASSTLFLGGYSFYISDKCIGWSNFLPAESAIYKGAKMLHMPPMYDLEMDFQSSQESPEGKIGCLASEVTVFLKAAELVLV